MSTLNPTADSPRTSSSQESVGGPVASAPATDEQRHGPRAGRGYWASLLTLEGQEVIHCRPDNLGEGGMHLTAPVGHGFAVGQRYELLVGQEDATGSERRVVGEGHYATVVRTEFLMEEPGGRVGVGLRFDQPLVL